MSIVGARPQFIKAAMVSRAIEHHNRGGIEPKITEIIVHTGQHYDYNMSQGFFDQMKIPKPLYNLEVGSASHGKMTGTMLSRIEKVLMNERPDWVLVFGDTNTTLAGALAAVKIHIPVAHVEAGLRSYNRRMPEEINRILSDRISDMLFCPTETAVANLKKEGITQGVFNVGDVMYDAFLIFKEIAIQKSGILKELELESGKFCLATIHRQENTDDLSRLKSIFLAFNELASKDCPFILPLHPRTHKVLQNQKIMEGGNSYVRTIQPVSYLNMIYLESNAQIILTDSGGMQKEALFAQVPCITLRDETEWIETVESGWNYIAGAEHKKIVSLFDKAMNSKRKKPRAPYGDGEASQNIIKKMILER